jgi:hypothetical protein
MSSTPDDKTPEVRVELTNDVPPDDKGQDKKQKPEDPPKKKYFSVRNPPRGMKITVSWPKLLPGCEPFVFRLRLALSEDLQKKQEEWAALPADKIAELQKGQILDELTDLLVDHPTGFNPEEYPYGDPRDPGVVLNLFVQGVTDPDSKLIVEGTLRATNNGYWATLAPQTFSGEI